MKVQKTYWIVLRLGWRSCICTIIQMSFYRRWRNSNTITENLLIFVGDWAEGPLLVLTIQLSFKRRSFEVLFMLETPNKIYNTPNKTWIFQKATILPTWIIRIYDDSNPNIPIQRHFFSLWVRVWQVRHNGVQWDRPLGLGRGFVRNKAPWIKHWKTNTRNQ